MGLSLLEELVPPPATPTAAVGDFAAVEAALGTALPGDYKELVRRYGYGSFCDFLHLWSPFFGACTMMELARGVLDADTQLARVAPNAVPFARYPDPDGVLPWARSDNGDVAYWVTGGKPEGWPVVLWNPRGGQRYDLVECGAAAFLAAWIGGETAFTLLPKPAFRSFDPWCARVHETVELDAATGPFAARLEALRAAFDPVEMRGAFGSDDDHARQVHLVASQGSVRLTYDTVYGHNVRLAAPLEMLDAAHARLEAAVVAMGSRVVRVVRS